MPIETLTFFYVALSGFMAIWTFRYFTNRKERTSEFEWLGLSIFWGLAILACLNSITDIPTRTKLLQNPLLAGFTLSFLGIVFGYGASYLSKRGLFSWISKSLGPN
jgi:hypothetical protein